MFFCRSKPKDVCEDASKGKKEKPVQAAVDDGMTMAPPSISHQVSHEDKALTAKMKAGRRRFKQQIVNTVKSSGLDDTQFDKRKEEVFEMHDRVQEFSKRARLFMSQAVALCQAGKSLGLYAEEMGTRDTLFSGAMTELDTKVRSAFEESANRCLSSLEAKLKPWEELERRCEQRDRLVLDFESYVRKVKKLADNPKTEPMKLRDKESKLSRATQRLVQATSELYQAFDYYDVLKGLLIVPELMIMKKAQIDFFSGCSQAMSRVEMEDPTIVTKQLEEKVKKAPPNPFPPLKLLGNLALPRAASTIQDQFRAGNMPTEQDLRNQYQRDRSERVPGNGNNSNSEVSSDEDDRKQRSRTASNMGVASPRGNGNARSFGGKWSQPSSKDTDIPAFDDIQRKNYPEPGFSTNPFANAGGYGEGPAAPFNPPPNSSFENFGFQPTPGSNPNGKPFFDPFASPQSPQAGAGQSSFSQAGSSSFGGGAQGDPFAAQSGFAQSGWPANSSFGVSRLSTAFGASNLGSGSPKTNQEVLSPRQQPAPSQQVQARALYTYSASDSGELSFQVGETLWILNNEDGGWWTAQKADGQRGLVPSNYVEVLPSQRL